MTYEAAVDDKLLDKSVKLQFPVFENQKRIAASGASLPLVYLDTAATAQKPYAVINAIGDFLTSHYGTVHRGAYQLSAHASELYENARRKVARFLGPKVSANQVIFTRGTTESINIVAAGLGETIINDKSRIVLPMAEHHANLVPWQQVALKRNCEIAYIPLLGSAGKELSLDLDKAKKLINQHTKIVAFAHVGNVLGQINPIAELIAIAKAVGAIVVIDAAQSVTCFPCDYFSMGADAVAFSGHKLYGPTGIGVLALTKQLSLTLPPFQFGGAMISNVNLEGSSWAEPPLKFEAGTPPIMEAIALGAAIDWIEEIGREKIHAHTSQLARNFIFELKKIRGIRLFSPESGNENVVSFRHERLHAHDIATFLDAKNIAVRAGHHCAWPLIKHLQVDALIRASFGCYSTMEDVKLCIDAIKNCETY